MSLIDEFTPLRILPRALPAGCFNTVRLAQLRMGEPLRLPVPGLRLLECILEREVWICVDSRFDHLPLIAWTGFRVTGRGLHEDVCCEQRLYHIHAGLLMGPALDAIERAAAEALDRTRAEAH
ncbi:MAG: hypothetical protein IT489_05025 [Gammaproteobacteria bacterium]|nr:hypothetical protein [Gammaproteobacteria bacterium]